MTNKYQKISFYASIATIVALFLAVGIYTDNVCREKQSEIQKYVSRIDALKHELAINYLSKNKEILGGKEGYLECEDIPSYRYFTSTLNGVLTDGIISDINISQDLIKIFDHSNDNNRILDSADSILREQLTLENPKSLGRCKDYMKIVIGSAEDLNKNIPITILNLEIHQEKTEKSVNPFYCKLPPFKKKIEFVHLIKN